MTTTVTMSGPGTTTIVNDAAAAILAHTTAMNALFNPVQALKTPGTPATSMYVAASSLNDMAGMMSDLIVETRKTNANLEIMIQTLNALQTSVAVQTTTQQLTYLDQAKNNAFNQATTNAALQRADLPPTQVKSGDFANTVSSTIQEVSVLDLQSKVVTITQQGIASAQNFAVEQGKWLVEKAWVGSGAASLANKVKEAWNKLFNQTENVRTAVVDKKAAVRTTLLGVPEEQLPPKKP